MGQFCLNKYEYRNIQILFMYNDNKNMRHSTFIVVTGIENFVVSPYRKPYYCTAHREHSVHIINDVLSEKSQEQFEGIDHIFIM